MKTSGLLDQLLKSGQDLLQKKQGTNPASGSGGLGDLLSGRGGSGGGGLGSLLSGAGGGTLAAGAMGLLLGNRNARKFGGKVITYGGLTALGVLAYKAYSNWQAQQGNAQQAGRAPMTIDRLPPQQAEEHSHGILRALIAAAKADGHVDAQERQLIEEELGKLTTDADLQRWFDAELNKPLDPVEVAAAATSPEMASEMYLASLLVVDEEHFMERAYLDELARQLKLDEALKVELEAQVRGVSA